jgi:hypothetical protein
VHKLAPEAGMFIKAKVNGIITNLLIDTGATVTLISTESQAPESHLRLYQQTLLRSDTKNCPIEFQ